MELTNEIRTFIDLHRQEAYELLIELVQIPVGSMWRQDRTFCLL